MPDADSTMEQARRLAAEGDRSIHKQHTISKGILYRFAVRGRGSTGLQLCRVNVHHPQQVLRKSPKGCGRVDDFVAVGTTSAEELWKTVEDSRLGPALTALDNGTLFQSVGHVTTIKDTIALHLARSRRFQEVHEQSLAQVLEGGREWFLRDPRPALEFYKERGIHLAGPKAREAYFDDLSAPFREAMDSGGYFRARVEAAFHWIRQVISQDWGLEVGTVDPSCGELLLGDTPAVTINYRMGRAEVALGDANAVMLPLGPRHLATLGPTNRYLPMTADKVEFCNDLQVRTARKYVYFRPGSNLERVVTRVRRA